MNLFNNKELRLLRPTVKGFYKKCLKVIMTLQPDHQKIWYDYTRLKFAENENCKDPKKIKTLLSNAEEELDWVIKVVKLKKN